MGTATTTFTLTVQAPTTVAATIANNLVSRQWSNELVPAAYIAETTLNSRIGYRGTTTPEINRAFESRNTGNPTGYGTLNGWAGKAFADDGSPANPRWWYLSGITGGDSYSQTAVRYDSATDRFLHWQGAGIGATDGLFYPWGGPHNFGGTAFDPVSRRLFRVCKGTGNPSGDAAIGWFNVDTQASGYFPNTNSWTGSTFPACEYVSTIGVQGSLAIFTYGDSNYRPVYRFDIDSGQWFNDIPGTRYTPTVPCLSAHSGRVYFSYGDGLVHRLDSDKVVTTLGASSNTPIPMNGGGTGLPNFSVWSVLGDYIYAFCESGPIYRFHVPTETWSGELDQMVNRGTAGRYEYTVAPLTAYGVFLFVHVVDAFSERALLWKP